MHTQPLSLTEQVRRAARESGLGCCRLARESGMDKSSMSRFLSGERDLLSSGLDRVAAALGLVVSRQGKPGAPIGALRGSAGERFPPAAGRPRPGIAPASPQGVRPGGRGAAR